MVGNQAFVDGVADAIGPQKIIRVVNKDDIVPHIGFAPEGAQPSNVTEYFIPQRGGPMRTCTQKDRKRRCSEQFSCFQWSWHHHSEVGDFSMREDFCRVDNVTLNSVYAATKRKRFFHF